MVNQNNDNVKAIDIESDNYNSNYIDKYERARKIETIADTLIAKLGNEKFRAFYCKVAWRLSEGRIWENYEKAVRGNPTNPGPLFSYLCKRDGV